MSKMSLETNGAEYPMSKPSTLLEQRRLDLQHQIFGLTLSDSLSIAPLTPRIRSILDLGCGTGTWALDIADSIPTAQVVAMDISPPSGVPPSNVSWVKGDIGKNWHMGHFDFIHGRMLNSAVQDWPSFLRQCWEHLEPDGYLELLEVFHPYRAENPQVNSTTSSFLQFGDISGKAWKLAGRDFSAQSNRLRQLQDLGFHDVRESVFKWPVGLWGVTERERRIGELNLENFCLHMGDADQLLAHNPDVTEEETKKLVQNTLDDVSKNAIVNRYYFNMTVHVARKPTDK